MQDPDNFTIPYTIMNVEFEKTLCDSGVSINLMPLSVVKRLSLGELTLIAMTLQMEDRTMAQPEGVLEDVLIKEGKFIFLIDFAVMDMEEDTQVPLLLGRPFLATRAALIDVKKGELTLRVGEEVVHFNLNKSLKWSECESTNCKTVEKIVPISAKLIFGCNFQDPINENEMKFQYLEVLDCEFMTSSFDLKEIVLCLNENSTEKSSSNEEKAREIETSSEGSTLKELPRHLKYAFLGPKKAKLVIISAALNALKEHKQLEILRKYKEEIAWSIEYFKGICPSICMHKILLEENAKTSIEHQRRLNLVMKEVFKKEVLKLLNAGFIYATSNSLWVSSIHVVPKKGGFT